MAEARREGLRVGFASSITWSSTARRSVGDGGLATSRELDDPLQRSGMATKAITDLRTGDSVQHDLVALLRQSAFSRLAGYEDRNNADRLGVDPTMRVIVGGRAKKRLAASTSRMSRFEIEVLTHPKNLRALMGLGRR